MSSARVMVAGASGFAGALAAELVWHHPHFELAAATAREDAGRSLRSMYPRYRAEIELTELDPSDPPECEAALVAYPHGASAPTVAALRRRGIKVVDFSADFRLSDRATYERWYGEHGAPELFDDAAYGLPELHREQIAGADLVAGPGCFPTAAVLALAPLARAGLIADVVIDAKTGISGSGRGGGDANHFVTLTENSAAYKTAGHRHTPEIAEQLAVLGSRPNLTFVPHLVPVDQGELVSAYVQTSREVELDEARELYRAAYADEQFVSAVDAPPGMRDVRDSNACHIYLDRDATGGRLMAFAAIDNLVKGAAGQVVQALNVMFGRPEGEGLSP